MSMVRERALAAAQMRAVVQDIPPGDPDAAFRRGIPLRLLAQSVEPVMGLSAGDCAATANFRSHTGIKRSFAAVGGGDDAEVAVAVPPAVIVAHVQEVAPLQAPDVLLWNIPSYADFVHNLHQAPQEVYQRVLLHAEYKDGVHALVGIAPVSIKDLLIPGSVHGHLCRLQVASIRVKVRISACSSRVIFICVFHIVGHMWTWTLC